MRNGGTITEAVSSQVWSGEAAVHVSIVNWEKASPQTPGSTRVPRVGEGVPPSRTSPDVPPAGDASPTPDVSGSAFRRDAETNTRDACAPQNRTCRLTFQRGDSVDSPWETFELPVINSSLSAGLDVGSAAELAANQEPPCVYTGLYPRSDGFMISADEAARMLRKDPRNRDVVWPFLVGREFLEGETFDRWVIDFQKRDQFAARSYAAPFAHVQTYVLPHATELAEKEKAKTGKSTGQDQGWLKTWWQHFRPREELIGRINSASRYMVCSRVTKRPIFTFLSPAIRPGDALSCFVLADDYSFGIIQSDLHWHWFRAKCSKLKGDFRYTPHSVFDTFPWPQAPTPRAVRAVADAAVALRTLRHRLMTQHGYSLRALYRTLDDPGTNPLRDAHTALDTAVRAAYAFPPKADPLAALLALNQACAAREKSGQPITPPGLPLPDSERAAFITTDCITLTEP